MTSRPDLPRKTQPPVSATPSTVDEVLLEFLARLAAFGLAAGAGTVLHPAPKA